MVVVCLDLIDEEHQKSKMYHVPRIPGRGECSEQEYRSEDAATNSMYRSLIIMYCTVRLSLAAEIEMRGMRHKLRQNACFDKGRQIWMTRMRKDETTRGKARGQEESKKKTMMMMLAKTVAWSCACANKPAAADSRASDEKQYCICTLVRAGLFHMQRNKTIDDVPIERWAG